MLMSEVLKNDFKVYPEMMVLTDRQRQNQISGFKYIHGLSNMVGKNISDWNVTAIFKSASSELIFSDKNVINEIFFEYLNESPEVLSDENLKQLKADNEIIKKSLMNAMRNSDRDLSEQQAELYYKLERIRAGIVRDQLIRKSLTDSSYMEALREIRNKGRWEFLPSAMQRDGRLYFITKNDIKLTHVNSAQNINITNLNMGIFAIGINVLKGELKIDSYQKNIFYNNGCDTYYHPHVACNGHPCWGEMLPSVDRQLADFDLVKILDLAYTLLTTYNNSDPYVHLYKFKRIFDGEPADQDQDEDGERDDDEDTYDPNESDMEPPPLAVRTQSLPDMTGDELSRRLRDQVTIPWDSAVSPPPPDPAWTVTRASDGSLSLEQSRLPTPTPAPEES